MKVPMWVWWLMDPYKSESKKIDPMLIKLVRVLPPESDTYKILLKDGKLSTTGQDSMFCRRFTCAEMKKATYNFRDKIREDGFWTLYKGYLKNWNVSIAVKLFKQNSAKLSYESEIELLCTLRHENFVSLIGCGNEKDRRFLVYSCAVSGTLYDHLHGRKEPLDWMHRLQICIGIARGLHYLHTASKPTIIHRDVKSSNILLDDKRRPKLSGFDLCLREPFHGPIVGTIGYLDPGLFTTSCSYSEKSDVYSFGVVLCEVVSGRHPVEYLSEDCRGFVSWEGRYINGGNVHEIVDKHLHGEIAPECLNKFLEVALSCVRYQGNDRPTMEEVLKGLEIAMELQEKADAAKSGGDYYYYPETSRTINSPQSIGSIDLDDVIADLIR